MLRNFSPLLFGALAAFGHAPFDLPFLSVLGLGLGLFFVRNSHRPFLSGWLLGGGYFLVSFHWIIEPFLVDPYKTGWMAPFALLFMAGGLALFWGAAAWGAARVTQSPLAKSPLAHALALTLCFSLAEFARAHVLTGFPWALVGYIWIDTPIYYIAAFIGPFGMTFLTFAMLIPMILKRPIGAVVAISIALIAPYLPTIPPLISHDAPIARMIHPDIPQTEKWNPDLLERHYQHHLRLSDIPAPADVIIWPETALYLPTRVAGPEIAARVNTPLITGHQRRNEQGQYFNSLSLFDEHGQVSDIYDKSHLVPFGEYIPLIGWSGLVGEGFTAGTGPSLITLPNGLRFQPLICYEGIFPNLVGATDERPDLLILITNDGWFGRYAGPAQHMAQARARTIELGLPMLRVANHGITAAIDGHGNVIRGAGLGQARAIDVQIPPARPATFYAIYRDLPFWGGMILMLIGMFWTNRRFRRNFRT